MTKTEPHEEHRWLERLLSEWTYEAAAPAESGSPPERAAGTETVRSLGDGTTRRYRDVIELRGDDHRVLTGWVLGDDGKWQQLMTAEYRRKK